MARVLRAGIATLAVALAVTVLVDGQVRQGRDTIVGQGTGSGVGDAWSVRCVNTAGDTFEACSGGAVTQSGTWTVTVAGAVADGVAVSGNPVRIAGKDGSGNTQDILTDSSGNLIAIVTGSFLADGVAAATNRVTTLPAIAETTTLPTLNDGRNAALYVDTSGILYTGTLDPCSRLAKTYLPINIVTAATTEITASLAGMGNHYYVCSINLGPTAGAQNVALVDDDSDNCGSVSSGLAGGTTAGTGWNFPSGGGIAFGNGSAAVAKTNGTNRVLCLVTSAAVQVSGVISVVAAP